jgi:hypothetical protein
MLFVILFSRSGENFSLMVFFLRSKAYTPGLLVLSQNERISAHSDEEIEILNENFQRTDFCFRWLP